MSPAVTQAQAPQGDGPPDGALIAVAAADARGLVVVTGEPGAVFSLAQVAVRNLHTGETTYGQAGADGSFTVEIGGTPRMAYYVAPAAAILDAQRRAGELPDAVGLVIPPAPEPVEDGAIFDVAGPAAYGAAGWQAVGRIDRLRLEPGGSLSMRMTVSLDAPGVEVADTLRMSGELSLLPLATASGVPLVDGFGPRAGWSSSQTASGVAVLHDPQVIRLGEAVTDRVFWQDERLTFRLSFDLPLLEAVTAGLYVPVFVGQAQTADSEPFTWYANRLFAVGGTGPPDGGAVRLPFVIQVGGTLPPALPAALFTDVPVGGQRGLLPDDPPYSAALTTASRAPAPLIVPPGTYDLAPGLPGMLAPLAAPTRGADSLSPPVLPLQPARGELTIQVQRPDGGTDRLPAADALQMTARPGHTARVTAPGVDWAYAFEQYGTYTVEVSGRLMDAFGRAYRLGGTYTVHVAQPLTLRPALLPGAPLAVGAPLLPAVRVSPPMPDAAVTIRLRLHPADGRAPIEQVIQGTTGAGGLFTDAPVTMAAAGEYDVLYSARFTDAEGRLWAGNVRAVGVVTSNAPPAIIARGARGIPGYDVPGQAWFDTAVYPDDVLDVAPAAYPPYHSGDVLYLPAADGMLVPALRVQDLDGAYTDRLSTVAGQPSDRIAQAARQDALPVSGGDPAESYALLSAVRPDVILRQVALSGLAAAAPVDVAATFDEQIGAGVDGLRPGDYGLLFGGVVAPEGVAGYASMFVGVDNGRVRVLPALTGPLLPAAGLDDRLALLPTLPAPGQVLTVGDRIQPAGQVVPPLPADVTLTLISPAGEQQVISAEVGPFGVFAGGQPLIFDRPGVWWLAWQVRHDRPNSAGLVVPAQGTAPGALEEGRYAVYVQRDRAPLLAVNRGPDEAISAGDIVNITVDLPPGWTEVSTHHTIATASYVLAQGPLRVSGGQAFAQYSPAQLSRMFPALESDRRGSGPAASDEVTITIAAAGLDAAGRSDTRTRTLVIRHDRLLALEAPQ